MYPGFQSYKDLFDENCKYSYREFKTLKYKTIKSTFSAILTAFLKKIENVYLLSPLTASRCLRLYFQLIHHYRKG